MNSYELKQYERKARLAERAERKQAEANARLNKARQMADVIPFGQPILVGHYSEGRDRNYRKRIDNNFRKGFELDKEAAELRGRANTESNAISSDDPDAVIKLREKLAGLEADQERMKAANKLVRAGKVDELAEMFSERVAEKLMEPDFAQRKGFPSYMLSNNNANIRRIKDRISALERAAERPVAEPIRTNRYTLREDAEENRIMFEFPGKPSAEIRTILKRNGFKWSPSRVAWVRMLNNAGRYAAKCVTREIVEVDSP
jgi:uncharacterized protein YciW